MAIWQQGIEPVFGHGKFFTLFWAGNALSVSVVVVGVVMAILIFTVSANVSPDSWPEVCSVVLEQPWFGGAVASCTRWKTQSSNCLSVALGRSLLLPARLIRGTENYVLYTNYSVPKLHLKMCSEFRLLSGTLKLLYLKLLLQINPWFPCFCL